MALRPWAKRMQVEVEQLPETLATLREAADNIKAVSADLTDVAAALNRITKALDSAGLVEATEMMGKSADAMRHSMAGFEAANKAVEQSLSRIPGADLLKPWLRK